jgi:uroporphyrinogen decarboxylase
MTSRERVLRTLNFDSPDRVPRDLWALPGAALRHGPAIAEFRNRWPVDFVQCTAGKPRARQVEGDPYAPGESVDEWGCRFVNLMPGVMGEVRDPIMSDYDRLGDLRPPVELLAIDVEAANAFCRSEPRFVFASGWARPFERAQFLRGTENVLMDIAEDEAGFRELLAMMHRFNCDCLEAWSGTAVDALVIMDDWGSQRSLLISPETWRTVFKPLYADYGRIAQAHGKKLFMHSDGYILDILDDLIEVGVDAINSQLFCMGIPDVAAKAAGRITFWGEIDRQHLLPFGSAEDVAAGVAEVVRCLYRPEGGVIAQFELAGDTRMENADTVFRTWDALTLRQ